MRRRVTLAAAGVVALGVVALAVAATHESTRGVARFREIQITHAAAGDYAGAVEVWRTRVLLQHRAQTVGTGAIACTRIDSYTSVRECNGTYILPRGRIQVAGEIITRAAFQLTIVGGTGVYGAAGGVMVVLRPGVVTFFLT